MSDADDNALNGAVNDVNHGIDYQPEGESPLMEALPRKSWSAPGSERIARDNSATQSNSDKIKRGGALRQTR